MGEYRFLPERSVDSYKKSDTSFIVAVILMWGIGIFTLFVCSSSYAKAALDDSMYFVKRQLIASGVGFAGLLFFAICPVERQRKLLPVMMLLSLVLCLMTFIPGLQYERNGAYRWIKMPFFTFQPSELLKFIIVLFLANYFDKYLRKDDFDGDKNVGPAVVVLVVCVGIVFLQKDFSTGLFLLFVGLLMFYIARVKMLWLFPFCILAVPAILLMILTEKYRVNRIAAFLNPDEYVQSFNFQSIASKRAISMGGFWGQGIGDGLEKLNNIPEVQSDYIFAGWAEAMGFIGVIFYFMLLIFFVSRAVMIALKCPDRFAAFGTFGCVMAIFFQSLMNVSVVCGLVPTTGITLPFFSSGGSSIIVTLCMCGFIINASHTEGDSFCLDGGKAQSDHDGFEVVSETIFS